jgi:hypothetical protein
MADEAEGFTVRDRRRRPSDTDDVPAVPPPLVAPERDAEPERPAASEAASSPAPEPSALPFDLRVLIMMFADSALLGLGEAADPATGQRHVDLAQAEEAIDVLILLREKTEGNRTPEESAALDDVLYDLEMRFVQLTQPPPA